MSDRVTNESRTDHCAICSGEYPAAFVEAITSATAEIGYEMTPKAFRTWLMDEARDPES